MSAIQWKCLCLSPKAIGYLVFAKLAIIFTKEKQAIRVTCRIAAFTKSLSRTLSENKSKAVFGLLAANICHAGVYPSAADGVIGMQTVAGYITISGIRDE